ncbi:MAG: cysteine--tRNA ligase, partial [Mesorhizobium sp.]
RDLPADVLEALSDDLATYAAFQRLTQLAGEAVEFTGAGENAAAASLKAALAFLGFDVGAAKVDEEAIA